jgi:hypothetical protein
VLRTQSSLALAQNNSIFFVLFCNWPLLLISFSRMSSSWSSLYCSAHRGGHPPSPRTSSVEADLLCKISLGQDKESLSDFSLIDTPHAICALGVSTRSASTWARGASAGDSGSTPLRRTGGVCSTTGGGESGSQDKLIHKWKGTHQPQKWGGYI